MAESKGRPSLNQGHALAVGFIENKLPDYHPFFRDPPVRYDKQAAHYVNVRPPEAPMATRPGLAVLPAPAPRPGVRPEKEALKSMKRWKMMFPTAMEKFRSMPGVKIPKPEYDIRNGKDWTDVYEKLEKARDYYTSETGISGRFRCVWRWTADNAIEPARMATKTVPQMDVVTPVLAAVQIILEAAQKDSEVRQQTLDAFNELEDVFADVELFLGTFKGEGLILDQTVKLVASVLLATERGIGYFTRSGLSRALGALRKGKDYEKPLLQSLTDITSQSKKLLEQALKAHIQDFHGYSQTAFEIFKHIQKGQEDIAVEVTKMVNDANGMMNTINGMNAKFELLLDSHKKLRLLCEDMSRRDEKLFNEGAERVGRLENIALGTSLGLLDSTWSSLPGSSGRLPWLERPYIGQKELWGILNISGDDVDTIDMEGVEGKGQELPLQDRAQAEQIVHDQLFQKWIMSPTSSKLMVYSNFSGHMMKTSALSLFCTTLTNAFRSREGHLCLVWFCGRHLGYDSDSDSDLGSSDSEDVLDDVFSLSHDEDNDYSPGTRQGTIKRMVRSLIAQLLCDYDFGPGHLLPPDIDPHDIHNGHNLSHLRRLLRWLVYQLPEKITVSFLIDGIVFYEREDFEDPMLDVLGDLLELTVSSDVPPVVKVLVTSPRPTLTVRMGFEDDNATSGGAGEQESSILSMDLLTPSHVDASSARVDRTLRGLEEDGVGEELESEIW
ncbi:hypothetical protein F5Y04DRAFT_243035 [Hypomontagnella monticulosa]|nr:hypothetical protein F5Y04DRAFT_243035 [Hypomontagnella monticulosa]